MKKNRADTHDGQYVDGKPTNRLPTIVKRDRENGTLALRAQQVFFVGNQPFGCADPYQIRNEFWHHLWSLSVGDLSLTLSGCPAL